MSRKRRRKNLTKIRLRNSTRVSLVISFLVCFAFSSAAFYKSIFDNNTTKIEEDIYTYTNEYNANYNVNIKNNSFIPDKSLPSGQNYISELIDSIDMDIKYTYTASKPSELKYNYKIDAIIGGSYDQNGEDYNIWNKTYNLKTSEELKAKNNIEINEVLNIDYKNYHKEVKDFKQALGISLDAHLYIKLTVNTSTVINHQEVKNEYISNFSITLGEKIALVEGENTDKKIGSFKNENTIEEKNINVVKVVFSLALMIVSIYIIYFVRVKTKKYNPIRNEFKLELNRILKSCQDRIVIVKNQSETSDEEIIDVKDFGELIKLSEELFKPILCWISEDLNNEEAYFSIISNKIRYRYILK